MNNTESIRTVEELIDRLKKCPPNARVVIKEEDPDCTELKATSFLVIIQETVTKEALRGEYDPKYFHEGEEVVVIL